MERAKLASTIALALVAGSAGVVVGASAGTAPTGSCTDPATHAVVIPGDGIRNDGTDFVCMGGALVSYDTARTLPRGFWWRTVTGHVGECGPHALTALRPGVIEGYGPGEIQSVLMCPPRSAVRHAERTRRQP